MRSKACGDAKQAWDEIAERKTREGVLYMGEMIIKHGYQEATSFIRKGKYKALNDAADVDAALAKYVQQATGTPTSSWEYMGRAP